VGDRRIGMEQDTATSSAGAKTKARRTRTETVDARDDVPVKLLVRAQDIKTLQAAHMNGTITLSLRAASDETIFDVPEPSGLGDLVAQPDTTPALDTGGATPVEQFRPPLRSEVVPVYHTLKIVEKDGTRQERYKVGTATKPAGEADDADDAGESEDESADAPQRRQREEPD